MVIRKNFRERRNKSSFHDHITPVKKVLPDFQITEFACKKRLEKTFRMIASS